MRPHPAGSLAQFACFGGILESDRALPGLPPAARGGPSPSWRLRTVDRDALATRADARVLGTVRVADGPTITLATTAEGAHLLDVSDTGRYRVGDADVAHAPSSDADPRAIALDVVGHVLPLLLHRAGAWPLHASAVATDAGALVLVGARGAGKSTLAAACTGLGAALVADDTAVLDAGTPARIRPAGLPLRVRPDVADALGLAGEDDGWGKRRLAVTHASGASLPVAAVLLVQPIASGRATIEHVAPRAAIATLAASSKLAALLGRDHAPTALLAAARLVETVPVRRLVVPRDLAALPAIARALLATGGRAVAA
jgi:hypothetical protein